MKSLTPAFEPFCFFFLLQKAKLGNADKLPCISERNCKESAHITLGCLLFSVDWFCGSTFNIIRYILVYVDADAFVANYTTFKNFEEITISMTSP